MGVCEEAVFVSILFVVLLAIGVIAEAQQARKSSALVSWMIALLPVARSSWRRSGKSRRKLGWIEGKNIIFEYRFAEQKNERLLSLLRSWFVLRLI